MTAEELEQRHRRRADEMERAREHFLQPLVKSYTDSGIEFSVDVSYGGVAESLLNVIKKQKGTQLFLGRKGTNDISRLIFGSVASTMAQVSPVPCSVVP